MDKKCTRTSVFLNTLVKLYGTQTILEYLCLKIIKKKSDAEVSKRIESTIDKIEQ